MTEAMDLDLWGLPASIGVGRDGEYGCEFEFDFCYVPDAMEEDAINEKCCVEVLKRSIAKADTEIFDLEHDLAILKGQLSWAKHDGHGKFYEVWTAAFREKITSLSRSLQTLRKGSALNADSGINHEPAERIHDIITALIERNFQTENEKEHIISKADIEAQGNTSVATASLGLSRPDKKQIVGTKNQPIIAAIREAKGLQIPEARLAQKHGLNMLNSTCDGRERSTVSMPECHKKVLDNDVKDGSSAVQGAKTAKGSEVVPFQQISEGKDRVDPTLMADSRWPSVKVEFDEHEPLIMFLNSQGSKRKKSQSTPSISRTESLEEENEKKPFVNDTTARSKLSPASESGGRRFGIGRKSAKGKLPGHTDENSNQISGLARNARSQAALSTDIKNPSMSSQSAGLQGGTKYSPLEKHAQETVVASECTRNKLENMNRPELCAMAKKHGIKGVFKLKKSLLVDKIACHLGISFADSCTP